MEPILESVILHLVRPEDLNHHGTLFAGQMAKWLVEAGFITASRLCGKPQDVVCVQVNEMNFKKPVNSGDIIELISRVAYLGATSITVNSEVHRRGDKGALISNMATFVTVDGKNKPYKHGFSLTEEYISKNKGIYEAAVKIRTRGNAGF